MSENRRFIHETKAVDHLVKASNNIKDEPTNCQTDGETKVTIPTDQNDDIRPLDHVILELDRRKNENERRKRIMTMLWPAGIQSVPMKQGHHGNCYAIAALWGIKHNPRVFWDMLAGITDYDTAKSIADPRKKIGIKLYYSDGVFNEEILDLADIKNDDGGFKDDVLSSGTFGDRYILRAHARFISRSRGGLSDQTIPVPTLDAHTPSRGIFSGGFPHRALFEMLGEDYDKYATEYVQKVKRSDLEQQVQKEIDSMVIAFEFLHQSFSDPSNYVVATAESRSQNDNRIWDRLGMLQKIRKKGIYHSVVRKHAYAIKNISFRDGRYFIEIINPHDESSSQIFSQENFVLCFRRISFVKKREKEEIKK